MTGMVLWIDGCRLLTRSVWRRRLCLNETLDIFRTHMLFVYRWKPKTFLTTTAYILMCVRIDQNYALVIVYPDFGWRRCKFGIRHFCFLVSKRSACKAFLLVAARASLSLCSSYAGHDRPKRPSAWRAMRSPKGEAWCGREDLNLHRIAPTRSLVLRVYRFRHGRVKSARAIISK